MTDREKMKQFFDIYDNLEGYTDSDKAIALGAWQARGELDAVRIEELEAELKDADGAAQILANQKVELSLQVAQLRSNFIVIVGQLHNCIGLLHRLKRHGYASDAKVADEAIASANKAIYESNITATPLIREWVRKTEIAELTAKLDKAREALFSASKFVDHVNPSSSMTEYLSKALQELDK